MKKTVILFVAIAFIFSVAVNVTQARIFNPAVAGGVTIGDTIGSGTANRVLFIDGSGNLADDSDMTFVTDTLTVTALSAGTLSVTTVVGAALPMGGFDITNAGTVTAAVFSATSTLTASSFIQASSTRLSVFDTLYVGGTATTTIQGDSSATSTFSGSIAIADNSYLGLGTGGDSLLYYDGTDSFFNLRSVGTGDLMIALAGSFPSPDAGTVHIWDGDAGSVDATSASVLVLESNTGVDISLLGATNAALGINFGTSDNNSDGRISYQGSGGSPADTMIHFTNGIARLNMSANTFEFQEDVTISTVANNNLTITAGGTGDLLLTADSNTFVGIGSTTPQATFSVSGNVVVQPIRLTDGATIAIDWSLGNVFTVTLGGDRTHTFSNIDVGQSIRVFYTQDSTGTRLFPVQPAATTCLGGNPTLSTGGGETDIVVYSVATSSETVHCTYAIN